MKFKGKAEIGVIGGTGSEIEINNIENIKVYTPYGNTSDFIQVGDFGGKRVAFLPRHGKGHIIPPHNLNFRANVWAMKELGVKFIISPSAVGSLKKEHNKMNFILVDQYIDRTKNRPDTFYEGGQVCHINQADPYCSYLRKALLESGRSISGLNIKNGGTYVCIEGPRFSTRAESKFFRQLGGDIIGMTTYPEVVLAAEKEICYCCIAMVTDLDVWAGECPRCGIVEIASKCEVCGSPVKNLTVSIDEVLEAMEKNAENLKKLLEITIPKIEMDKDCGCRHSLTGAII